MNDASLPKIIANCRLAVALLPVPVFPVLNPNPNPNPRDFGWVRNIATHQNSSSVFLTSGFPSLINRLVFV